MSPKIKCFEIIVNKAKINSKNLIKIKNLISFLRAQKICLKISPEIKKFSIINLPQKEIPTDLILAFGGDGTILQAAKKAVQKNVPILGVNIGGFGFLSECSLPEAKEVLKKILDGNYFYKKSMLLCAKIFRQKKVVFNTLALNDVVVNVSKIARLGHFKIEVSNFPISVLPADGIIISTPAGSTAYSLSCGGPLVSPQHSLLILTPISAHTLFARSFIISDKEKFGISIAGKIEEAVVTVDGQEIFPLHWGDIMEVEKASKQVKFLSTNKEEFYHKVKTKLLWGEKIVKDT